MKKILLITFSFVLVSCFLPSCTKSNETVGEIEVWVTDHNTTGNYTVYLLTENVYLNSSFPRVFVAESKVTSNTKVYFKNLLPGNYVLNYAYGSNLFYKAVQVIGGQTSYDKR
jgi:hypothetical protein